MITQAEHAYLVKWAGTDFQWENGPLGKHGRRVGSRPNSAQRRALREYVETYANGQCVFCGTDTDGNGELCHVVASGPKRRGFVPGNIALGCYRCNRDQVERFGEIVPMSAILLPELVPSEWPTPMALQTRGKQLEARISA